VCECRFEHAEIGRAQRCFGIFQRREVALPRFADTVAGPMHPDSAIADLRRRRRNFDLTHVLVDRDFLQLAAARIRTALTESQREIAAQVARKTGLPRIEYIAIRADLRAVDEEARVHFAIVLDRLELARIRADELVVVARRALRKLAIGDGIAVRIADAVVVVEVERVAAQRQRRQQRRALRLHENRFVAMPGVRDVGRRRVEGQQHGRFAEIADRGPERGLHHGHDHAWQHIGARGHGTALSPIAGEHRRRRRIGRERLAAIEELLRDRRGLTRVIRRIQSRHVGQAFVGSRHRLQRRVRDRIPAPSRREPRRIVAEETERDFADHVERVVAPIFPQVGLPVQTILADCRHRRRQPDRMAFVIKRVEKNFEFLSIVVIDEIPARAVTLGIPPAAGLRQRSTRLPRIGVDRGRATVVVRVVGSDRLHGSVCHACREQGAQSNQPHKQMLAAGVAAAIVFHRRASRTQ
jgi:hypothetical protein